jgi:heterotetrameric sarcosine oxidase delta subunit
MMLIACPYCGPRAHVEFSYERPVEAIVPLSASPEQTAAILYHRANPRGASVELWRHSQGCGAWLRLERDTLTHQITDSRPWAGP